MRDESEAAESERLVWTYRSRHIVSIAEIVKRVAKLKDVPYARRCQLDSPPLGPQFIVPDETLSSVAAARTSKGARHTADGHFREVDDLLRRDQHATRIHWLRR
jgi:hypothetical protein